MEQLARQLIPTLPAGIRPEEPQGSVVEIGDADPVRFWSRLMGALSRPRDIALLDPSWPAAWREAMRATLPARASDAGRILVPTGGSGGMPRLCIHTSTTLMTAADGYARRFGSCGLVHAVLALPPFHIGGLMPVLRSARCGGRVAFADARDPGSLTRVDFPLGESALSLVPTQLRRLLDRPEGALALRAFGLILVGGAGCDSSLLEEARAQGLRLAPCYGSTETAAMVTALDPESFLAGAEGVGTPLPHARVVCDPDGRIRVHSEANLLGYLPGSPDFQRDPLTTGDLGRLDVEGRLHVIGRADRVIITGGKKVNPEGVEAAALQTGWVNDAHCRAVPDPEWGQRVELDVLPADATAGQGSAARQSAAGAPDRASSPEAWTNGLLTALRERLPAWAIPKRVQILAVSPRSAAGKWRGDSASGQHNQQ